MTKQNLFYSENAKLVYYLSNQLSCKYNLTEEVIEEIQSVGHLTLWHICCQHNLQASGIRTYLYIRIRGAMIDLLRKRKQVLQIQLRAEDPLRHNSNLPFHANQQNQAATLEHQQLLNRAYQKLDSQEKNLIKARYFQDKRFCEIYGNRSKSWISKLHSQTLKKLRNLLLDTDDIRLDDRQPDIC